jgi:hypothetical protein
LIGQRLEHALGVAPPVVSISTTRSTPSALGLLHFSLVSAGKVLGASCAAGACWACAGAGAGVFASSAQALAPAADTVIARANAKAVRIVVSPCLSIRGPKCLTCERVQPIEHDFNQLSQRNGKKYPTLSLIC